MFKEATLDYISKDPTTARKVVRGLEREVIRLQAALAKRDNFDGETGLLEEIEIWLEESQLQNEILKKKMFGRSSEKRSKDGKTDAESNENQQAESQSQAARKRQKPEGSGRGQVGIGLPEVSEVHALKEGATCDCELKNVLKKVKQDHISYIVDYVPAKLICRKIIRKKYRAKKCGCRVTAPGPTTLVNGGQYGIDLAAEIVAKKFQDQLPWERQAKAFWRDGLKLAPTTLWNQSRHVADVLEDVYEGIRKNIEAGYCRHADETRWRIIEGVNNKTQYAWLFRDEHHAFFTIRDSRGGEVPLDVMSDAAGAIVADDYSGYNSLVTKNKLTRVQCWSHTRRKFVDILKYYPTVEVFLDLVGDLYREEKKFRKQSEQTAALRRAMCEPIIEAIDTWRKNQKCLPKSGLGKALAYMNDNWDGLILFLTDPDLPLDNNPAENGLRQLVLGRKNFLFNRSLEGARVASILYTIAVSCSMNNVDLKEYLKETILRIRNCRGFQLPYDFANERENIQLIWGTLR